MAGFEREVDTGSGYKSSASESGGGGESDGLELSLSLGGSGCKSHGMHANKALYHLNTIEDRTRVKKKDGIACLKLPLWDHQEEAVSDFPFGHCLEKQAADRTRKTAVQLWNATQNTAGMSEVAVPSTVSHRSEGLQGGDPAQVIRLPASIQSMENLKERNDTVSVVKSTITSASNRLQQTADILFADPESWQWKGFETVAFIQQHQQQTFELQRKKELQAWKHQEARKRRRTLIEEKQLKRQRRQESRLLYRSKSSPIVTISHGFSPSFTVPATPCSRIGEGERLQQSESNRWVHGWESPISVTTTPRDCEKDFESLDNLPEQQLSLFRFSTEHKSESEISTDPINRRGRRVVTRDRELEACDGANRHLETTAPSNGRNSSVRMEHRLQTETRTKNDQPLQSVESKHVAAVWLMGKDEMEWQPVRKDSFKEGKDGISTCEDIGIRSERRSKKEEYGKMQRESRDDHAISKASATLTLTMPPQQPFQAQTSTPSSCDPCSFPLCRSIPYPFLASASTTTALKLQMGFPYSMQFLSPPSTCQHNPNPVEGPTPELSGASNSNGMLVHECGSSNDAEPRAVESQSTLISSVEGWSSSRRITNQVTTVGTLPSKSNLLPSEIDSLEPLEQVGLTHTVYLSGEKSAQRGGERSRDSAASLEKHREMPSTSRLALSFYGGVMERGSDAEGAQFVFNHTRAQVTSERCSASGGNINGASTEESFAKEVCSSLRGSFPALTLVSTTGPGPNGKTVSGIMYILNKNQVMIVCACHGEHLSTGEFVQHAGGTNLSNPERSILVNPFSSVRELALAMG